LRKDGWTNYSTANSDLLSDDIWALGSDNEGRIWISSDKGLSILDGTNWTNYPKDEYGIGLIQEIQFDENDNLWILSWDGVGKFDGYDWKIYPHLNQILAFDFDQEGRTIIATSDDLYYLENENWTRLDTSVGGQITPPFDSIADMQIDSQGLLWIVSGNGDLHAFNGDTWMSKHSRDAGLEISYIDHMVIDPLDRVWILPFSGGIYMFDPEKGWFDFTPDPIGIYINYPNTVEVDPDGKIWIGSQSGVAVFNPPKQ